ncbi:MAG: hypothetical protein QM679_02880 [Patulibacter sp.]
MGTVRDKAEILIKVVGGVRAAAEAKTAARGLDQLGDDARQAERAALRLAFAVKWLNRHLRSQAVASAAAAIATTGLDAAMLGLRLTTLSVASVALPALAVALWHVTAAAGVWTGAMLGGFAAVGAGAGLMYKATKSRFDAMKQVAGTAAADMQDTLTAFKDSFAGATAHGADAVMRGITRGLGALEPLVRRLRPQFTAIGGAIGDVIASLSRSLAGRGKDIAAMFDQVPVVIRAAGTVLKPFVGLLISLGKIGAPLVAKAFGKLAGTFEKWTGSITTEKLKSAQATLRGFWHTIKSVWKAFSAPIKPALTDALKGLKGGAGKGLLTSFAAGAGQLVAALMRLGVAAMPIVTKAIGFLSKSIPRMIGSFKGAGKAFGDTFAPWKPTLENVIIPFVSGVAGALGGMIVGVLKLFGVVGKALGFFTKHMAPLKGVFRALGAVVGLAFGPGLLGIIAKVIGVFGRVGSVVGGLVGLAGRLLGVFGRAGGIVGAFGASVAHALGQVVSQVAGLPARIASAAAGLWDGLKRATTSVWHWLKSKFSGLGRILLAPIKEALNGLGRLWNNTLGKLSFRVPKWVPGMGGKGFSFPKFPELATGGVITQSGWSWVGEQGPELVRLPSAATVVPAAQSRRLTASDVPRPQRNDGAATARAPELTLHVPVVVDGRELARAVRRVDLKAESRA